MGAEGASPDAWPDAATQSSPPIRTVGHCDAAGAVGVRRFSMVHFNDLQARYGEMIAGKSRYAYIAGYLRAQKAENPATLVLDAGDDYEKGSVAEVRSLGETTRQMIQALPIDVRTIGNHDFAYGESALLRDVTMSAHPVLAANLRRGEGDGAPFLPFVRIDVGCVKVGIVGLTTRGYGADDEQDHDPYYGIWNQDDSYLSFLYEQHRLHRDEVDVLIALTHIGQTLDTDLAKSHWGYDFVIGGHSEDMLGDLEASRQKDKTHAYVMQMGHFGRYLGRADVAVYPDGRVTLERYNVVTVDQSLPVADDVHELAVRLEKQAAPDAHLPIATVKDDLGSGKDMVDLVMRAAADRWGADGLVLGTDVFFDGLRAGPLTLQRLYDSVMIQREPAGTTGYSSLYIASLTGAEVAALRSSTHGSFVVDAPDDLAPGKSYRIAIEKRAMTYPGLAFSSPPAKIGPGHFAGEILDVLEAYARARSAKGLTL